MKKALLPALFICAVIGSLLKAQAQKPPPIIQLPNDGANAVSKKYDHVHRTRYIELFLVGGNRVTGDLRANVYNTTFFNGWNETNKDSAPEALVDGLDYEKLAKQYGVFLVHLNGPKLWMPDWFDVEVGPVRDFGGLKAPWVANVDLKGVSLKAGQGNAYKTTTIERKSMVGWNKGTTVFLIDDAGGNTWVLKGMQLGLRSKETYDSIAANFAEKRLSNLPQGWTFRTKVLDRDLIETPEDGVEPLLSGPMDDIFDRLGAGYSNYTP
jgi:hypothetical protein